MPIYTKSAKYCETKFVKEAFDKGLTAGMLLSASILIQIYHEGAAEQLINEAGLHWDDLRKVKVDPFDRKFLKKIKPAFR